MSLPKMCSHCNKLPASGVWEVVTRDGVEHMLLCAECGLTRIRNRVRCFTRGRGTKEEVIYYKDVRSVRIVHSFVRHSETLQPGGLKQTVEDPVQVAPLSAGAKHIIASRKPMQAPQIHSSITNRRDWSYRDQ